MIRRWKNIPPAWLWALAVCIALELFTMCREQRGEQ